MKTKILAIAVNDGWAYIKIKDQILLIKPPYAPAFTEKVTKEDVERAILLSGFEKVKVNFESLEDAIQYIKDEFVSYKKVNDIKIPSNSEIKEVLQYAPKNIIENFLDRVETQLISEHKFQFASRILNDILELPITMSDKELKSRAEKISQKCIKKRAELYETSIKQESFKNILREYSINSLMKYTDNKSISKIFFNFS